MTQRLAGLVRWDSVVFVQRFRSRAADAWFMHFPLLGNEMQYVLGIPPLAWFVHDAAVLRRFTLFGAIACFVANGLKGVFKLPRPPLKLHVGVGGANHDLVAQQYGFPSTHSAHALVLAWVLAREFELTHGAAAAAIALHTAHVCVSRLYVGVHSLADVVGGLCVGAACVASYEAGVENVDQVGGAALLVALIVISVLLALLYASLPAPRATNSAYAETCKFVGLYLGTLVAGTTGPLWPMAGGRASLHASLGGRAFLGTYFLGGFGLEFVTGLLALGLVRTALSALAKRAVRLLPTGSGAAEIANIARNVAVSAAALWWVVAVHPSRLLSAAGLFAEDGA